jgi:hypothetical protein
MIMGFGLLYLYQEVCKETKEINEYENVTKEINEKSAFITLEE